MAVIRALKTEKGFIKSYKRAIKTTNNILIAHKNNLRLNTIQKWIPSKTSTGDGKGLTNTVDKKTGTVIISGVTTEKNSTTIGPQNYVKGHKYLARSGLKGFGSISNRDEPHFFLNYAYSGQETNGAIIFTCLHDGAMYNLFYFSAGVNFSTPMVIRPQLYDLTEIFGAGNEPSTVEEAEAILGKGYIPYQYL